MTLDDKISRVKLLLRSAVAEYTPCAFANSFGAEDMVLTDLIAREFRDIEIFSLDTGRLPEQTYQLMAAVNQRYRIKIRAYFPDASAVEQYVKVNGVNGFYDSMAQRKQCCHVRKVEPLKRALAGKKGWITGLRREQAPSRQALEESQFDADHGLMKFNPLADWSNEDVWHYLREYQVLYNALHDQGYPSIGCAPCTRAVKPGEDIRAGRWWWETADQKECGLHVRAAANDR
jgi:phosphoadenosine phosphosulfate reductase